MARGNWSGDIIKPKPRCRLCRKAITKKELVRLDGVKPAHRVCAMDAKKSFIDNTQPSTESLTK